MCSDHSVETTTAIETEFIPFESKETRRWRALSTLFKAFFIAMQQTVCVAISISLEKGRKRVENVKIKWRTINLYVCFVCAVHVYIDCIPCTRVLKAMEIEYL